MQITDILAQMGGLQSMARELGVSEDAGGQWRGRARSGDPRRVLEAGPGSAGRGRRPRRPARAARRRRLARPGAGAAADRRQPGQRCARSDLRLEGREPCSRAARSVTVGTRTRSAAEDAADAGDADLGLHGPPAECRRGNRRGGGLGDLLGGLLGGRTGGAAAAPGGAGLPGGSAGSARCSMRTVTATRSTTSSGWPARRCVDRRLNRTAGDGRSVRAVHGATSSSRRRRET